MKKVVPFKKDLIFKTNLSEITSISLEHDLHLQTENLISGNFIIKGEYKMADSSTDTEVFSFDLPFEINIDDKYITKNIVLDIDDFYYEIVDNKILNVNIDVLIDKLEEKPLIINNDVEMEQRCVEDEFPFKEIDEIIPINLDNNQNEKVVVKVEESTKKEENIKKEEKNISQSLFNNLNDSIDTYSTYKVYIFRENDTIETILQKYNISKDILELYNNVNEIKLGDKIIIPNITNEKI